MLCTFDILSDCVLLQRMLISTKYDILFMSQEVLRQLDVRKTLQLSQNYNCPTVLFLHTSEERPSPSRFMYATLIARTRKLIQIAIHYLPLQPCINPLYMIETIPIHGVLSTPFSILDMAVELCRIVFLPVFMQFGLDPAILQAKCRD